MNDKIKKLLKGAGYSDEVISSTEKEDFDAQKAVEENNSALKEHYKSLLENQIKEEVRDEITQQSEGKIYKMVNHELKKLGVPMEKVEDAALFGKLKIASEHFKSQAEQASGKVNEDFKALQEENLNLKNQLSEKEEWAKTEIEKVKEQTQSERKAEKVDLSLQKQFTSIPANKLLGNKHSEGFYLALKNVIGTKYDTDIENDQVVFYEKGTKKKVTGKTAEGKDDFLKAQDILTQELKALSFWVESNGQGGQGQQDQNSGGNGNGGGQQKQKSQRAIELEKKIAEVNQGA